MPNVSPLAAEETTRRPPRPIVAGFSARALAEAIVAWGGQPIVIDHFTDHDCRELAFAWYQIVNWGDHSASFSASLTPIIEKIAKLPTAGPAPWLLLGGGTENWPALLRELQRHFRVLGPNLEQLAQLRDYRLWREAVVGSGIHFPVSYLTSSGSRPPEMQNTQQGSQQDCQADSVWLWKPTRGAGGISIRRMSDHSALGASFSPPTPPALCQQKIEGRSLGAHCILAPNVVRLLGVTEAWNLDDWPAPKEFIYRGSWGPLPVAEYHCQQILQLCRHLQAATGYIGWLQIDFIEDVTGQLWLLELNPRWAAGMEILLLAGINPVDYHLAAWQIPVGQAASCRLSQPLPPVTAQYGKGVAYAEQSLLLSTDKLARLHALPRTNFVDLPALEMAGKTIAAGQPVLTVRTTCNSHIDEQARRKDVLAKLRRLMAVAWKALDEA